MKILIVGGGISGLSTAYYVHKKLPTAHLILSEQRSVWGGQLCTLNQLDLGAEAFITRRPEAFQLLEDLGLTDKLVYSNPAATPRLYTNKGLITLPVHHYMGIPYDPLQLDDSVNQRDKEHAAELLQAPLTWEPHSDTTIAQLVDTHVGQNIRHQYVDPLLSGVYAASTEHISVRYALPGLAHVLDTQPATFAQVLDQMRPPPRTDHTPLFSALQGGMATLVHALKDAVPCQYVGQTHSVRTDNGHYSAHCAQGTQQIVQECDAIVFACGVRRAAQLLQTINATASSLLTEIPTSSPVVVAARVNSDLPEISGVLIPDTQDKIAAKAITVTCKKWPHLTEQNIVRLSYGKYTASGNHLPPVLPSRDVILKDLSSIFHSTIEVNRTMSYSHTDALPVVSPRNWSNIQEIPDMLPPTVALAGSYLQGVGIPSCISSARQAAQKLQAL